MCGIAGILGTSPADDRINAMVGSLRHRGPDDRGVYRDEACALGHTRLRVLDLTDAGHQPMTSEDGRYRIVFNGEVFNYRELRDELGGEFRSATDTEVVLRAYVRWGGACLDRFVGMFSFAVWDAQERRLFAARDRFGVKPFCYATEEDGALLFASEPKALHAAGLAAEPDEVAWATWLRFGHMGHGARTWWAGIRDLEAGHMLTWRDGTLTVRPWYDLAARVEDEDGRSEAEVIEEYVALLEASVALRFRSDIPVGINLSGGLDSSVLLGLVHAVEGEDSAVTAFTFSTGDDRYDETVWVEAMLKQTNHQLVRAQLRPEEVPALARSVHAAADGPGGGLPTLAYARLFEAASDRGVTVLLDGQGMDEQWAGYDYYAAAASGAVAGLVQSSGDSPYRPGCLAPAFARLAESPAEEGGASDGVRRVQLRDIGRTKLPRALRYNDRVSMRASCELREPFLDHRLVELALRQPADRKVRASEHKWLLRRLARDRLPRRVVQAPKRALQTPQREWLRGPLRSWVESTIDETLLGGPHAAWFDAAAVREASRAFLDGRGDNSYYIWQWIEAGLSAHHVAGGVSP